MARKKIFMISSTTGYKRVFRGLARLKIIEFSSELSLIAEVKKDHSIPVFVVLEHGYKALVEILLDLGVKVVILVDAQYLNLSSLNGLRRLPRVRLVVIELNTPKKKGLFSEVTINNLRKALSFAKVF